MPPAPAARRWPVALLAAALIAATLVVAPLASPASAQTEPSDAEATDDFERADGPLGDDWVADRGDWAVVDGAAVNTAVGNQNNVATHRGLELGSSYTVSADLDIVTEGSATGREWSGIAANVHGTTSLDYYLLRVSTASSDGSQGARWQLLRMANTTSPTVIAQGTMDAPYGTPLRLTLSRDGTVFDVEIVDTDGEDVLVDETAAITVVDPARVGGHAGLYAVTGNLRAESFALTTSTPAVQPPGPLDCIEEGDSYDFPSSAEEVLETSTLGRTWAGMYIEEALLTRGDDQYVGYWDEQRRMTIAHRTLGDDEGEHSDWTYEILDETLGWDSHNYISLGLDRDGHLHVSGNMHNDPLVYFRTTEPGDITTLTRVDTMISAGTENSVTYPEFVNRQDGSLVFSYRNGGSGDGVTYFNVYDEDTDTWSRLIDEPLFDGQGSDANPGGTWNSYFEGPTLGPDGYFHLLWVWRDTPDAATNSMLSYAKSENLIDWVDSEGNPLETPFRYGEGDVVDPIPDYAGLLNGNAKIGFDADGEILISYHKYDEVGGSQVYAARPDGDGGWDIAQISDWEGRWQFGGGGTIVFEVVMQGSEALANGDVRVDLGCFGTPQSIVIDDDLEPLAQVPTPTLPDEITDVRGNYPGLQVNVVADDSGATERGQYVLRYESLGENRDRPRDEWPTEGSELQVVLVGLPDEDTAAPTVTAEVAGDGSDEVTVTLAADDGDGSGVDTVEYRVDGGEWTAYDGAVSLTDPGAHTVEFRATDRDGNVSEVGSVTVTVSDGEPEPACPDSDDSPTVVIGGVDTGVANVDAGDGCTVSDLLGDEDDWPSRAAYVRHLGDVLRDLHRDGVIGPRDRTLIFRTGVRAGIGRR